MLFSNKYQLVNITNLPQALLKISISPLPNPLNLFKADVLGQLL